MLNTEMLMAAAGAELKTAYLNNGEAWVAPVSSLATVTGRGGPRKPSETVSGYFYSFTSTDYGRIRGTSQWVVVDEDTYGPYFMEADPTGMDYCGGSTSSNDASYSSYRTCYTYHGIYRGSEFRDAEAGAPAQVFGLTFPGSGLYDSGYPSYVTFNNVAVVAGQTYYPSIPDYGSITVTYYA